MDLKNNPIDSLSDEHRKKLEELEKNFHHKKDELSNLVRQYPLTAIAIAAGVGFLLGKLLNQKR